MKKAFLAGAGIAATLIGAPAFAMTGFVGAEYSGIDVGPGSGTKVESWGANGSVDFGDIGYLGVQLDAGGSNTDSNASSSDSAYFVSGHVYHRYGNNQFGAVAGIASADSTHPWAAGLEFQHHGAGSTLSLSGVFADADAGANSTGGAVEAGLKGFVNDHFTVGGSVGYASSNGADGFTWGLNTEVQLGSSPFSVYAAYDDAESNDSNAQVQAVTAGVRFNFGVASLRDRDAKGPSLTTLGVLR